jgi:tetratricopeptide (TPR) repeat protein
MSDQDNRNGGSLLPAGRRDVAPVAAGNPLLSRGITDLARHCLCSESQPVRLNPQDATFFYNRGLARFGKGNYGEAIKDFDEAIRLDPNHAFAYRHRGKVWCIWGLFGKANKDFSEAIHIDPQRALFYYDRGVTHRHGWTIKDLDEAIRIDPTFANAYYERGLARAHYGLLDEAIKDFEEAIHLDPEIASRPCNANHVRAYICRGIDLSNKKEYDKAIRDFGEAIRLDPKCVWAFKERASAWSSKKEYDKAIRDYEEAIRLDSKDAKSYAAHAWLLATIPDENVRNGKRAIEMATEACELTDWKDTQELNILAAAYAEAGHFDQAVLLQTKVLEELSSREDLMRQTECAQSRLQRELLKHKLDFLRQTRDASCQRLELYKQKRPFRQSV